LQKVNGAAIEGIGKKRANQAGLVKLSIDALPLSDVEPSGSKHEGFTYVSIILILNAISPA